MGFTDFTGFTDLVRKIHSSGPTYISNKLQFPMSVVWMDFGEEIK